MDKYLRHATTKKYLTLRRAGSHLSTGKLVWQSSRPHRIPAFKPSETSSSNQSKNMVKTTVLGKSRLSQARTVKARRLRFAQSKTILLNKFMKLLSASDDPYITGSSTSMSLFMEWSWLVFTLKIGTSGSCLIGLAFCLDSQPFLSTTLWALRIWPSVWSKRKWKLCLWLQKLYRLWLSWKIEEHWRQWFHSKLSNRK